MIGRDINYGMGKETTFGTAVSPTQWIPWLDFSLVPRTRSMNNESALGNVVKTNGTTVTGEWAEGSLEAKFATQNAGMFLLGAFGSVANATNADASGLVYNHTYNLSQDVNGQSYTFVRKDPIETINYAGGRIGQWELSFELDDYLKMSADILARKQSSTTATPAYPTTLTEFVAKHISVKTATNVAGLSGATAISNLESFTLRVNPNLEADWAAGSSDPYAFSSRGFDLEFEMKTRYTATNYRDAYRAGTPMALQVSAINTDVTIGTSAKPSLTLTAPKMVITDWDYDGNIDDPISQQMTGTIHFSLADAYALRAVLTDLVAAW